MPRKDIAARQAYDRAHYQEKRKERLAKAAAHYRGNKAAKGAYNRGYAMKTKYGITVEQYQGMFDTQGGVCAICGDPPGTISLHVDHDHVTGTVRALLCMHCNQAIGMLHDSAELCIKAAAYLRRHGR